MAARGPRQAEREVIGRLLQAAFEGKQEWLDTMVQGVGYQRPDAGVCQADLVACVPSLTATTLNHWQADGLASAKRGRLRIYQWSDVVNYLYERFVGPGRPRAGGGMGNPAELIAEQTRDTAAKADLREMSRDERRGELMARVDVERKLVGMALQCRAMLLGMAATLAPQLEHQPAPDVRKRLESYATWLANEMSKGRVHVPAAARDAVREAIAAALGKPRRKRRRRRRQRAGEQN